MTVCYYWVCWVSFFVQGTLSNFVVGILLLRGFTLSERRSIKIQNKESKIYIKRLVNLNNK